MATNGLTAQDIAERMGISPETVEVWIRSGQLKGEGSGDDPSSWRISEEGFAAFQQHQAEMRGGQGDREATPGAEPV